MRVFEVTGRATKREKFNTVWRCGVPWPVAVKDGPKSITHQLRLFTRSGDPNHDELVQKEPVIDEETGLPRMMKTRDGKETDRQMMRVKVEQGTGAPVRRKLHWMQREDGSRVVECYADTFELAKNDELFDLLEVKEVDPASVVSIADAKDGESYEDHVAKHRPRRSEVIAKGAAQATR